MKVVAWLAGALAAYYLVTEFIELGTSFLLMGIVLMVGLYFIAEGLVDLWTEIISSQTEPEE